MMISTYFHAVQRAGFQPHKTSQRRHLLLKCLLLIQDSEQSYICVLGVEILPLSMSLLVDFRIVSTVLYFHFVFHFNTVLI